MRVTFLAHDGFLIELDSVCLLFDWWKGALPPLPGDYLSRFSAGYRHILSIDRHESWTDPAVAGLLQEISPRYLVHELTGRDRPSRRRAVQRQAETLRRGGIPAEPPRQQ